MFNVRVLFSAFFGLVFLSIAAPLALSQASHHEGSDRTLIKDLQARYLFALDFQDPESYAETFTEDGILDYGAGVIEGREAIADLVRQMQEGGGPEEEEGPWPATGRHNITNIVIDINGDTATSVSYWFHVGNNNPERNAQINSYGHYEDELVKVDGEWLFSKRKIYNEQVEEWIAGEENPVVHPGDGPEMQAE